MQANIKYLKDESDNIISPIVSDEAVMMTIGGGVKNLKEFNSYVLLFDDGGNHNITTGSTITLNQDYREFRHLLVRTGTVNTVYTGWLNASTGVSLNDKELYAYKVWSNLDGDIQIHSTTFQIVDELTFYVIYSGYKYITQDGQQQNYVWAIYGIN